MINCSNKILSKYGYIPILSVREGLPLYKGKIYDIYFEEKSNKELRCVSYCSIVKGKLKETRMLCKPSIRIKTPDGFKRISALKACDEIVIFDEKYEMEFTRTLAQKRKLMTTSKLCAYPITTYKTYIVEGFIIDNDGLQ